MSRFVGYTHRLALHKNNDAKGGSGQVAAVPLYLAGTVPMSRMERVYRLHGMLRVLVGRLLTQKRSAGLGAFGL